LKTNWSVDRFVWRITKTLTKYDKRGQKKKSDKRRQKNEEGRVKANTLFELFVRFCARCSSRRGRGSDLLGLFCEFPRGRLEGRVHNEMDPHLGQVEVLCHFLKKNCYFLIIFYAFF
jgi:hypothetical protein